MSGGRVTTKAVMIIAIGLAYGIAFVVAYTWGPTILFVVAAAAYAANAWAISSTLLAKWEQPERAFGMLGFAALLTLAETYPPFFVAASLFGV